MRKIVLLLMLFCLMALCFFTLFKTGTASGETLHVGTGQTYSKIQDAINAANESDTIYVHVGTYNENVIVNKTLSLSGEDKLGVIIQGNGDHTIKIISSGVTISAVTIKNTGESYGCVYLNGVNNCLIKNCEIKNGGNGVYLVNSNSNTLQDNTFEYNNIGIYLSSSDTNIIKNNYIQNNNANGVFVTSTSDGNTFYLNHFSENPQSNARDLGTNNWNYNNQGNYWDDYTGVDDDGDGIGDTPYDIPGGDNQDLYPLGLFPTGNQKPIATIIQPSSPQSIKYGEKITFNGQGYDPDSDDTITGYNWRSDKDGYLSSQKSFTTSSLSVGTHKIYFKVKDNHGEWSDEKTVTITVSSNKQKPIAIISSITPLNAQQGEEIEFTGRGEDPDGGLILAYNWRSSLDGFLSDQRAFTKTNLSIGTHKIYFKVKDDENEWSSEVSETLTIVAKQDNNEQNPEAKIKTPKTGYPNISILFDGSNSIDPDGTIKSYLWDFGDNSTGAGKKVYHKYSKGGVYTIKLTVIDNEGLKSTNETQIIIKSLNKNGENKNNTGNTTTPGFELPLTLITMSLLIILKRKTKKEKK